MVEQDIIPTNKPNHTSRSIHKGLSIKLSLPLSLTLEHWKEKPHINVHQW